MAKRRFVYSRLPGLRPAAASANSSRRCAGTNMLSRTIVLLPVPARPIVSHVSSITQSVLGTTRKAGALARDFVAGRRAAQNAHCELSQPLANDQRPLMRYPPASATASQAGA